MNEQTIQRKQLKARLELTEQDFAKGRCTEGQLETARSAYQMFRESTQGVQSQAGIDNIVRPWVRQRVPESRPATRISGKQKVESHVEEFLGESTQVDEAIREIRDRLDEIDQEKARLSNSLKTFPKDQNAGDVTSRILELREEWRRVKDTESYVLQHGCLPEENVPAIPDGWTDKLPRDKFELNKRIRALKINIESPSKWPAALQRAKTPAKKQQIQVKINQGMLELAAMEALFKSL